MVYDQYVVSNTNQLKVEVNKLKIPTTGKFQNTITIHVTTHTWTIIKVREVEVKTVIRRKGKLQCGMQTRMNAESRLTKCACMLS